MQIGVDVHLVDQIEEVVYGRLQLNPRPKDCLGLVGGGLDLEVVPGTLANPERGGWPVGWRAERAIVVIRRVAQPRTASPQAEVELLYHRVLPDGLQGAQRHWDIHSPTQVDQRVRAHRLAAQLEVWFPGPTPTYWGA